MSPNTRSIPIIVVCALLTCIFPSLASAVIIIDDYTTGSDTLTAVNSSETYYDTQSGLPTSHVAGGVRHMDMFTYSAPASIQVAGGVMNLNSPNGTNYFNIIYNAHPTNQGGTPALNLNLLGYEKFEVTFSRVDRSMGFLVKVRSGNTFGSKYVTATAPGVVEVPLNSFSNYSIINWSDIDMVRLEISTYYKSGSGAHTEAISDFRVVPEPASITLLVMAGGLLLRRRRKL